MMNRQEIILIREVHADSSGVELIKALTLKIKEFNNQAPAYLLIERDEERLTIIITSTFKATSQANIL